MEKAKQTLAFLFRRSGKQKMNDNDIYMALSYELGWFTPVQSKDFIKDCLDKGLLKKDGKDYVPNFEYEEIDVPLGFKMDGSEVERKYDENASPIIRKIIEKGMEGEDEINAIRKLAEKEKIIPEVAALIIARDNGMDVSPFLKDVWEIIKKMD